MITRLNVYAGLAGLYFARDDAEAELGLPAGLPYELPMLIQDRDLEIDEQTGQFTGRLSYTDSGSTGFTGTGAQAVSVIRPRFQL